MEERKLTKEDIDRVRDIEGFPVAKDEDIIALSRPPYYTACPNPFIGDFIREHGTQYDEETDDYHREPFAADVSEGKNDPIYNAHSYHTKVPHKAIMRYILHYTNPGDIVFDGFCGTGMTGVAAQMCGSSDNALKYQFEQAMPGITWGRRNAVLSDLSPAATFIAYSNNCPPDVVEFQDVGESILDNAERELAWMYETQHVQNGQLQKDFKGNPVIGRINYTVWSDVLICPSCSKEMVFWDTAYDDKQEKVVQKFQCLHCGSSVSKRDCSRAQETIYDPILDRLATVSKQIPVLISYQVGNKRYTKKPDKQDLSLIQRINETKIPYWVPLAKLPDGFNTEQPKNSHGLYYTHQFYTHRNLYILAYIWEKAKGSSFQIVVQSIIATLCSKLVRYNMGHRGNGVLTGTLYIPSLIAEANVLKVLRSKFEDFKKAYALSQTFNGALINLASTTDLRNIDNDCIDYIFTDPPFGANINYSELSFLWESWLGVFENIATEAIMNNVQQKGLPEYQHLMEKCFFEYYRVLKPGRWMTVEFHNSQNSVWNAITEAILRAGFIIADVRTLDKKQGSFKQVTTTTSVKQDLVISAYKPKESFVRQFTEHAGDPEMAWEFVRQHLQNVPIAPDSTGKIEVVSERQDYLLFDRMVAFHIMRGFPVPMDAHTFYAGLRERFIQRDGMFFLPDQVNEYDERRQKMELQDQQLSLFITDEKSAIIWLNVQLRKERQSYSEIQPKFLQDWHRNKFEQMPELLDMLKENFLQDEDGKWYVPDLSDKADLEKLRRKRLLKDFYDIYTKGTGRIKNARTEAIRVGFDECWKERNYSLIVKVGDRLPETILQEDPALLMYYDNAANRM
jgi:DNA modification methylase